MHFRLRIGPFTFGRGGTRLSLWKGGTGVSVPLTGKKGRSFGKVGVGPISGYFGGSPTSQTAKQTKHGEVERNQQSVGSYEGAVIKAFKSDRQFLERLRNYGVPWRGVQEHLKEELPEHLTDRDNIAYRLVPKVMAAVFGQQNTAWKSEKRTSKSGKSFTTWIVIIKTDA